MSNAVCVIPRDSIKRAMKSESSLLNDFSILCYADFICGTIYVLNEIGVDAIIGPEDEARKMWYLIMQNHDYWSVGSSSKEDELIAYTSFTYARYIVKQYNLDKHFTGKEIMSELINGDIFIYDIE
jgi:hypothetical protein